MEVHSLRLVLQTNCSKTAFEEVTTATASVQVEHRSLSGLRDGLVVEHRAIVLEVARSHFDVRHCLLCPCTSCDSSGVVVACPPWTDGVVLVVEYTIAVAP